MKVLAWYSLIFTVLLLIGSAFSAETRNDSTEKVVTVMFIPVVYYLFKKARSEKPTFVVKTEVGSLER